MTIMPTTALTMVSYIRIPMPPLPYSRVTPSDGKMFSVRAPKASEYWGRTNTMLAASAARIQPQASTGLMRVRMLSNGLSPVDSVT